LYSKNWKGFYSKSKFDIVYKVYFTQQQFTLTNNQEWLGKLKVLVNATVIPSQDIVL
jgi:hypothetical protein